MLQAELDRQLADFERIRAEFEIAAKKLGGSDTDKYLKTREQAKLNVAVKDVELAKFKLDMADLFCPVNGIVKSAGGIRTGLNVSPASNPVVIIDKDTLNTTGFLFPQRPDILWWMWRLKETKKIYCPGCQD